jgi:hypothetical protein
MKIRILLLIQIIFLIYSVQSSLEFLSTSECSDELPDFFKTIIFNKQIALKFDVSNNEKFSNVIVSDTNKMSQIWKIFKAGYYSNNYLIENTSSNKVLDPVCNSEDCVIAQNEHIHNTIGQEFYFKHQYDCYYLIIHHKSKLCVDIYERKVGAPLVLKKCGHSSSQLWKIR